MCYTAQDRDRYITELNRLGFAHVASEIKLAWDAPDAMEHFRGLLIDSRANTRAGFPPHVYRVILKLYTIYAFMHEALDEWTETYFVDTQS